MMQATQLNLIRTTLENAYDQQDEHLIRQLAAQIDELANEEAQRQLNLLYAVAG